MYETQTLDEEKVIVKSEGFELCGFERSGKVRQQMKSLVMSDKFRCAHLFYVVMTSHIAYNKNLFLHASITCHSGIACANAISSGPQPQNDFVTCTASLMKSCPFDFRKLHM
jgi:hypothetical protein